MQRGSGRERVRFCGEHTQTESMRCMHVCMGMISSPALGWKRVMREALDRWCSQTPQIAGRRIPAAIMRDRAIGCTPGGQTRRAKPAAASQRMEARSRLFGWGVDASLVDGARGCPRVRPGSRAQLFGRAVDSSLHALPARPPARSSFSAARFLPSRNRSLHSFVHPSRMPSPVGGMAQVTVPRQLLRHLRSEGLAWISADGSICIDGGCFYYYAGGRLTGIPSRTGVRTVSSGGTATICGPTAASLQGGSAAALLTAGGYCGRATGLVLYHVDDEEAALQLAGPQPSPFSPVEGGLSAATKMRRPCSLSDSGRSGPGSSTISWRPRRS
jgi:hypothetical protein